MRTGPERATLRDVRATEKVARTFALCSGSACKVERSLTVELCNGRPGVAATGTFALRAIGAVNNVYNDFVISGLVSGAADFSHADRGLIISEQPATSLALIVIPLHNSAGLGAERQAVWGLSGQPAFDS
jgi:hypothetical protein